MLFKKYLIGKQIKLTRIKVIPGNSICCYCSYYFMNASFCSLQTRKECISLCMRVINNNLSSEKLLLRMKQEYLNYVIKKTDKINKSSDRRNSSDEINSYGRM